MRKLLFAISFIMTSVFCFGQKDISQNIANPMHITTNTSVNLSSQTDRLKVEVMAENAHNDLQLIVNMSDAQKVQTKNILINYFSEVAEIKASGINPLQLDTLLVALRESTASHIFSRLAGSVHASHMFQINNLLVV